jgi:CRP-like cAMP-binding protein
MAVDRANYPQQGRGWIVQGARVETYPPITRAEGPAQNQLLSRLPPEDYATLAVHLVSRSFASGVVLHDAGDLIQRIYFIESGTVTLLEALPDGSSQYTSIIGREGALGLSAGLGSQVALCRAVVQTPLKAQSITAAQFSSLAAMSAPLRTMIARYNDLLLAQIQQNLVCNTAHYLQARLCRWLLHARDGVGSDTLLMTQQFLSQVLGAQRTSVNSILGGLQSEGFIDVQRGKIRLRDAAALERKSCCCYAVARRLMNGAIDEPGELTSAPAPSS